MVVARLLRFFWENKVLKKYDYPPISIVRDPNGLDLWFSVAAAGGD